MQVSNVRFGFAANSSSTHYLIIVGKKNRIKDKLGDYFGWDHFTALSRESKNQYAASILRHHLVGIVGETITRDLIKVWLDVDVSDTHLCLGIDHQSVPALPRDWNGLGVNREFFESYRDFILDKHVVILGGNDNETKRHPLMRRYDPFILPLIYDQACTELVARKDPEYGFWTLFDRKNGHKIRLTFSKDQLPIERSSVPELVDIKITDHCNTKCSYCYQGSTPEGKHANSDYVRSLLYTLGELNVFEVALGGGEPTTHPDFIQFLNTARWKGIVPNFTTKTIAWLNDNERRDQILSQVGSFALSVTSSEDVRRLGFLVEKYKIPSGKVQVQVIDGVVSSYGFERILYECSYHNFPLVILGFKETGRGDQFKKTHTHRVSLPEGWWIQAIKTSREKGHWCPIGVDTVLAKKYESQLIAEDIDPLTFSTKEGVFSCYVDAVEKKMGPSSYMPDEMVEFNTAHETKVFLKHYNSTR